MHKSFRVLAWVIMACVISIITGCVDTENQKGFLVGEWQAKWHSNTTAFPHIENKNMLSMNGKLRFLEDGTVEILAYGFDGCVFMSDTMKNEMSWNLNGDTINLLVKNDDFGFPYHIQNRDENSIQMVLLEDINLELTKN